LHNKQATLITAGYLFGRRRRRERAKTKNSRIFSFPSSGCSIFPIIPYFIGYASAFSLSLNLEFPYSLNYPHGGPAMAAAAAAYCVEGQRHQRGIS
jgi:hypothetical protein